MALTQVSRGLLSTSIVDNGNATAITIDSSENVGIGMTPASSVLLDLKEPGSSSDLIIGLSAGTGARAQLRSIAQSDGTSSAVSIHTTSGGATNERIRLDSSGNVGIGTTSPSTLGGGAKLTVNQAADGNIVFARGGSTRQVQIGTTSTTGYINADNASNGFAVHTNGTERMRINSSGNLLVGTTSSMNNALINVNGGINTTSGIIGTLTFDTFTLNGQTQPHYGINFDPTGGRPVGIAGYNGIAFASAGTERMRIDSSGNLLAGLTSITDATSRTYGNAFSGSASYANWTSWGSGTHTHAAFRNGTNQVGYISTTSSSTNYGTFSDQRLKENIVDAPSASDDIDAIQVRSFDWKVDGSHQKYGMVAQELQSVAPEAVSGDADSDEMMGVDYSKLVPMLVKEIQSLRNRVAQLENN